MLPLAGLGADFACCVIGMDRMELEPAPVVAVSRVRASMDAALPPLLPEPPPPPVPVERELRAELNDRPEWREWADASAASASSAADLVPVLDLCAGSDQIVLLDRPGIVVIV